MASSRGSLAAWLVVGGGGASKSTAIRCFLTLCFDAAPDLACPSLLGRWMLAADPDAGLEMFGSMDPPLPPSAVLPMLTSYAPQLAGKAPSPAAPCFPASSSSWACLASHLPLTSPCFLRFLDPAAQPTPLPSLSFHRPVSGSSAGHGRR